MEDIWKEELQQLVYNFTAKSKIRKKHILDLCEWMILSFSRSDWLIIDRLKIDYIEFIVPRLMDSSEEWKCFYQFFQDYYNFNFCSFFEKWKYSL